VRGNRITEGMSVDQQSNIRCGAAHFNQSSSTLHSGDTSLTLNFGNACLTLTLLMWRIWWAPNNASRWQMGFNSAFYCCLRILRRGYPDWGFSVLFPRL